jgi:hypothetical protein
MRGINLGSRAAGRGTRCANTHRWALAICVGAGWVGISYLLDRGSVHTQISAVITIYTRSKAAKAATDSTPALKATIYKHGKAGL